VRTGRGDARAALAALPGVRSAVRFGDALHVTTDADVDDAALLAALAAAGLDDAELHEEPPSLEDVFIQRVSAADRSEATLA
jgi:hypothetical protein